jgi:hypothetical protein
VLSTQHRAAVQPLTPLGFDQAAGGDEVLRQLVLARIIEPTSQRDGLRALAEASGRPAPR